MAVGEWMPAAGGINVGFQEDFRRVQYKVLYGPASHENRKRQDGVRITILREGPCFEDLMGRALEKPYAYDVPRRDIHTIYVHTVLSRTKVFPRT
jgi:hypothetical protein